MEANPVRNRKTIDRILVIGCGGSGKSTFSVRLAQATGLGLIHLDSHYWKSGWKKTPEREWRSKVGKMVLGRDWIIDGSYFGTLDLRLRRAHAVILFEIPRWVCLWRVCKRRIQNLGRDHRLGMPEGCREQLYGTFLKWVWNYRRDSLPAVWERLEPLSRKGIVFVVRNNREADAVIEKLRR